MTYRLIRIDAHPDLANVSIEGVVESVDGLPDTHEGCALGERLLQQWLQTAHRVPYAYIKNGQVYPQWRIDAEITIPVRTPQRNQSVALPN